MAFSSTNELESILLGKRVVDLKLYNVNDDFFVFDPKNLAVIDGGISMQLEYSELNIAWNADLELFDVTIGPIESLLQDLGYYLISEEDLSIGRSMINQKIERIEPRYSWYHYLNDDSEASGPKNYVLEQLIIYFANKSVVQIATIDYSIENRSLIDPVFNIYGTLMIATNNIIGISDFS